MEEIVLVFFHSKYSNPETVASQPPECAAAKGGRLPNPTDSLERIIASRVKLQPDVESFIRGLAMESDDSSSVRAGLLSDNRVLRVVRVVGSEDTLFILSVEEDRNCDSIARAARRHGLTRRETEVLSLMLDGSSAGEGSRKC